MKTTTMGCPDTTTGASRQWSGILMSWQPLPSPLPTYPLAKQLQQTCSELKGTNYLLVVDYYYQIPRAGPKPS